MSENIDHNEENPSPPKQDEQDESNVDVEDDQQQAQEEEVEEVDDDEQEETANEDDPDQTDENEDETEAKVDGERHKIQVSARIRGYLPWEDPTQCIENDGKALGVRKNTKSLIGETIVDYFHFHEVFGDEKDNEDIFQELCLPLCYTTIDKGYNSILIAYGQTGAGKTYTLLGKPNENITGVLPMCVRYFLNHVDVEKVMMSAVEIYGVSTQKINVYDLLDEENWNNRKWQDKQPINNRVNDLHAMFTELPVASDQDAFDLVHNAQQASHFAPTGKNPESSRGHIAFIFSIHRKDKRVSYFVGVDLAGSEGESALTPEFAKKVSAKTLKTRRLEAGIINYGLSQLQKILQELRNKKDLSDFKESGLRKVLHPYINIETYISVLFNLSPSKTNIKSTRSTLRVANTVSMIEIVPKTIPFELSKDEIIRDLNKAVKEQSQTIQSLDSKLAEALKTSSSRKQTLDKNKKSMQQMEGELKELKQTETTMIRYAESLKRKLAENESGAQTELNETKAKLSTVEAELQALKAKEGEFEQLTKAIDNAIAEADPEQKQQEQEKENKQAVTDNTETSNNTEQVQPVKSDNVNSESAQNAESVQHDPETKAVLAVQKFTALVQNKDKQMDEMVIRLQRLEEAQQELQRKDEVIDEQRKELADLQAKMEQNQTAAVDDIQLAIDVDDDKDQEHNTRADDKDAKIAELEQRCQQLSEQVNEKKGGCACIIQ